MANVLIVVDMLNDFVRPGGALFFQSGADIINIVKQKIYEARKNGEKVVYLCDAHAENDREFEAFPPHCIVGTEGAKIVDELKPTEKDIVIEKTRYSGFYNTSLEAVIAVEKPEIVKVVGVCTSICVMGTVADLANRDYKIMVHADAVADFDSAAHKFALSHMKNIYRAEVREWE